MLRAMHTLPLTCAAALLALSVPVSAQTSTTKQTATATTQVTTTQNAGQALVEARKALNAVLNTPAPSKEVFDKLNEIKTQYLELEKAYSSRGDWKTAHAAIVQRVTELTSGGTSTGTASTATATTGATGTSGKAAPAKLDTAAINNLQAFNKALADFAAAMGGATAVTQSAETGKTTVTTGATGTMGTTTTVTGTSASGTTSNTIVTSTSAASEVDPHLAEMSKLIAAALASTATAAGADVICVDRKTLQDLQTHIQAMMAGKKP